MLKDLFEDFFTDLLAEGLWDWAKRAPRWIWFTISALALGAAAYFWFAMNGSFWTWPALVLAVVIFIAAFFAG